MAVEGHMLTLPVDLSKEFGPSASGKTITIVSTEGSVSIPDREEKVGRGAGGRRSGSLRGPCGWPPGDVRASKMLHHLRGRLN